MPGSSEKGKSIIKEWFEKISNRRLILDVGPGWGTYSTLLRESNQTWHAVEIHRPYVKRFKLKKLYDKIFVEDIRKFVPTERYDVTICGDVLEHMKNDEAIRVLKMLLDSSEYVIVSLPLDAETNPPPGTGDTDWGNRFEVHVGKWSHQLFIDVIKDIEETELLATERYPEIAVYLIKSKRDKPRVSG